MNLFVRFLKGFKGKARTKQNHGLTVLNLYGGPCKKGCPHPISDQILTLFRFLEHLRTSLNPRTVPNCTQFQIMVRISYPISDQNDQNLYPISDENDSKTIPLGVALTYMAYIWEYPPGSCTGGGLVNFTITPSTKMEQEILQELFLQMQCRSYPKPIILLEH